MSAEDLVGKSLKDFNVQFMWELFKKSEEGLDMGSAGVLKDEDVARIFVGQNAEKAGMRKVVVITDGSSAVILGNQPEVLSDEAVMDECKQKALSKLDPADKAALGL